MQKYEINFIRKQSLKWKVIWIIKFDRKYHAHYCIFVVWKLFVIDVYMQFINEVYSEYVICIFGAS